MKKLLVESIKYSIAISDKICYTYIKFKEFIMSEIVKNYKITEKAKQAICEALGLPVNTDDETVIYAYIESIDNEPIGKIDPLYSKEMDNCTFVSAINRDIDTFIKYHKVKNKKPSSKQRENDFQQIM